VDYSLLSDEDLVERLATPDLDALDALYGRHARSVFALTLKLLGDREQAEEIVQECFLKLWRRPAAFARERGRLLPWLLGVAHHGAVDALRHRQIETRHRVDGVLDVPDLGAGIDPEATAWQRQRAEAVARALRSLPEAQRLVVELAYYRGLTQTEIAERLAEPLGTVKTRIRLAMQKLRASVEMQTLRADEG